MTKRLTARRLDEISVFLLETYESRDLDGFARLVPAALTRLIRADVATYSEINPVHKRAGWHYQPSGVPLADFRPAFERFMDTDPLVGHFAKGTDGRATTISDLMTHREFRARAIYSEFYQHLDVEHQIAFLIDTAKPILVGMTLNRSSSDFTKEDRQTLNLLRPHLIQAYRNAETITRSQREIALMTQGIERIGRALIFLTRERVIDRATTQARRWLGSYFSWPCGASTRCLPDLLDRWLGEQLRKCAETASIAAHPAKPFSIENDRGTLIVRAVGKDDGVLLLLEERPRFGVHDASLKVLQSIGLSARESEVLSWVLEGKTNPEIAIILGMSARTVQTHLDHIYRKLDVHTRAGAAAKAATVIETDVLT